MQIPKTQLDQVSAAKKTGKSFVTLKATPTQLAALKGKNRTLKGKTATLKIMLSHISAKNQVAVLVKPNAAKMHVSIQMPRKK